jgi:hypothetical protein
MQNSIEIVSSDNKNEARQELPILASRDEMNLAEFPLAVLSTRIDHSLKTLEFRDTQRLPNGDTIERQWIITGADKFGLPTSTDDDVLLGLMRLSMDQGFRYQKVFFTRYELLKILRWSTEGRSYSRLTKSLDRLSGVRIRAANAFFDNSLKAHQTKNFGIIDAYEINDGRGLRSLEPSESKQSFFIWSDVLFNSFQAGFIKKLDLNFYFTLKSAVSRRLYRYLDKHFYYKSSIEKPLASLAFEKLGLSRNYKYISQIKQQIEPACEELVNLGFLSSFEFSGQGASTVIRFHADTTARITKSKPEIRRIPEAKIVNSSSTTKQPRKQISRNPVKVTGEVGTKHDIQRNTLVEALLSRGIHYTQARRLLAKRSEAELFNIDNIISYYDHLVETNDVKISRNRVGFLYRAVEFPYKFTIPKSFLDKLGSNNNGIDVAQGSKRPERRIVNHLKAGKADNCQEKKRYNEFVNKEVQKWRSSIDDEELSKVYQQVEARMAPLRKVLHKAQFQEALEGCVRDEIVKKLNIGV